MRDTIKVTNHLRFFIRIDYYNKVTTELLHSKIELPKEQLN